MAFWKNITEGTDTPTNATNLSRAERYLEAVAGANGDFYVDIDGADGLEVGDILRIAFPTATNGASNARLSIDGASGTFRNIFSEREVQTQAAVVEEQNLEVTYDGTQWVFLEQNSPAKWGFRAVMSGATSTDNNAVINFNEIEYDINANYDTTNKRFTAPYKGLYVINSQIGITSPVNGNRYGIQVFKNGSAERITVYYAAGTAAVYAGASYLIPLNKGDVIDVRAFFTATSTINPLRTLTYFEGYLLYKY